jgi:GDP-L-fucose synthase
MVQMDSLLIAATQKYQTRTFIGMGSVCAYPEHGLTLPATEAQLLAGAPEEVNGYYGSAKRTQLSLLQAARKEWGLNGVHLILANLYGPGDKFAAGAADGHVIPATIVKMVAAQAAGQTEITAWGNGTPTRSFLYIYDAVDAVVAAIEREYASPEPMNVCSAEEVSVGTLLRWIAEIVGYTGAILWDASKPGGQQRRLFSSAAARRVLGWMPETGLRVGLRQTVQWYRASLACGMGVGSRERGGGDR